jgi:hypothetical protein
VAVKYGLSTNLWTAIVLIIPILLLEASQVSGFTLCDCSPNQLKTQTIDLTAPKDCQDPETDYYPVRTTELKIIITEGNRSILATQSLVLSQDRHQPARGGCAPRVQRRAHHRQDHCGGAECGLPGRSQQVPPVLHQGRKVHRRGLHDNDLTRKDVTYEKSNEETTIKIFISKVRGTKLVVRDAHEGILIWSM